MLDSVSHGYVSLEMVGGFGHTAVDSPESWAWILDSVDTPLRTEPHLDQQGTAQETVHRATPRHT